MTATQQSLVMFDKDFKKNAIKKEILLKEITECRNIAGISKVSELLDVDKPVFDRTPLNINILQSKHHRSYPNSDEYEYESRLTRINLDDERKKDILNANGFIISQHKAIQKDIKDEYGIFSTKFGQTLSDANPFIDRYKCECGNLKSRINYKRICPLCKKPVTYVDDDYSYFGWMVLLEDFYVIHPALYKSLEVLIGPQRLINIIDIYDEVDEDGHSIELTEDVLKGKKRHRKGIGRKERGKDEPYYGIGISAFKANFVEICDFYLSKASNKATKKPYYDDIMANKDAVFTQSIPVFTTHLRPFELGDKKNFAFEKTNAIYTMMNSYKTNINDTKLRINSHRKTKEQLLFKLQVKFNELYVEIVNILSGKKGVVRQLAGGRFNFSSRDVIVQNPKLRIDQVTLPYWCLVDILQQQIINVLTKTHNMSYNDAYNKWYKANIEQDKDIVEIIYGIMWANPEGLPVIINRNPSINRGSLLQMFCVDMTFDYTMALPLQILPLLAADFDGDVLNVYYIINKAFFERSYQILNPRNSMYISNNDGRLNEDVIPARDTLINANTFVQLGRKYYTKQQLDNIERVKKKYANR